MAARKATKRPARSRTRTTVSKATKRTSSTVSKQGHHKSRSAHPDAGKPGAQAGRKASRPTAAAPRAKAGIKTPAHRQKTVHRKPSAVAARGPGKAPRTATTGSHAPITELQLRAMPERDYMNPAQLAYFRQRLIAMREEVLDREVGAKERLHDRENFADPADRATAEEEHWLDLRLRERESMLLRKIDSALQRIHDGEYGYCEKTGEAIGIPRLIARPTATVCVDVKDQDERVETHFRDR